MKNSKISWTDHTFNGWTGCTKISAGCANCYAEAIEARRFKRVVWGTNGTRHKTAPSNWRQPLRWNKEAAATNTRYRVFTSSLADVFEDRDELAPWRDELHKLIEATPHLDWLVLTKRPQVAARYYNSRPIPTNVWLGTSVEDPAAANERIPVLTSIPARVRFLSCEPLLEDLGALNLNEIHWVIAGGESGPHARPVYPDWIRSLRDQCSHQAIPFFFKQWGGGFRSTANGRTIDGRTHLQFPTTE